MNTKPKPSKPVFMMSKQERTARTVEVRALFQEACKNFIEKEDRPAPQFAMHVKGRKVGAWHIGYTGWDEIDGPLGWPMTLDELGNLYKAGIRRPVTKFTLGQMERAFNILDMKE